MTCDQTKPLFADYWAGTLADKDELELEAHLGACEVCRTELERLGILWRDLERIPQRELAPEPSPKLRDRFYETLAAYRHGAAAGMKRPTPGAASWRGVWQIAAGVALLLGGVSIGYGVRSSQAPASAELAQLRSEVNGMRQLVALSLMQQQSASERLRGVSWAYRVEPSDREVLTALLDTMNHDPNVNVRLAAVDALHPFGESPFTREAVTQALPRQTAPIVQVALIDLLVDLKEKEASRELERMAADNSADAGVRERARWALEKLQ